MNKDMYYEIPEDFRKKQWRIGRIDFPLDETELGKFKIICELIGYDLCGYEERPISWVENGLYEMKNDTVGDCKECGCAFINNYERVDIREIIFSGYFNKTLEENLLSIDVGRISNYRYGIFQHLDDPVSFLYDFLKEGGKLKS